MLREIPLPDMRDIPASKLKRGPILALGSCRLRVELDTGVSYLYSARSDKAIFGRESVELFRVQAGVRIPLRPREVKLRLSPGIVELRTQDGVQVSHTLRLFDGNSQGYSRLVRFVNRTGAGVLIRLLTIHDPTSLNFRRERDPPAEIGVNAFNRSDQVVMDDVGDTTGVRIIAFSPMPSKVYMTRDKQRALDLLASGELPETTAGMSGAILILSEHDFELKPGASAEVAIRTVYNPTSLESALADLASVSPREPEHTKAKEPSTRTSDPSVTFALAWAGAAMRSIEAESDQMERISSGFGLRTLRPALFEQDFEAQRARQRKDGLLPRGSAERGGPLETSLFLTQSCAHLQLRSDKKLSRKWYPALRKAGLGLASAASKGLIFSEPSAPDGWRRRLESGYPTGQLAEVNLVAAHALADISTLAYSLGKGADSAAFKESSLKLGASVLAALKDRESGTLALNIDPKGRVHWEVTADQAVALASNQLDHDLSSSIVHRLLEKDFETGYGPRTVPSTNPLYFSPSYGEGQLGGYWTRAALSHVLLAYRSGYPVIAGQGLERISRLVHSECEAMGGMPGEFPYWFDPERRAIGSHGSDPVAASRLIESVMTGELGVTQGPAGVEVKPPADSRVRWISLSETDLCGVGSLFMGRTGASPFVAHSYPRLSAEGSRRYVACERIESSPSLECLLFWDLVSVLICVGNLGNGNFSGSLAIPLKGKPVSRSLYADLEEFDAASNSWRRIDRKKLLDRVELQVDVRSSAWKAFKLSQITS